MPSGASGTPCPACGLAAGAGHAGCQCGSRPASEAPTSRAAGATSPAKSRQGDVIASRYRLEGLLGRGAFAVVHAATDLVLHRRVAIKLLGADRDPERFLREARAHARLEHPGIVAVHDVGHHGHEDFLVLEHVEGGTLRSLLEAGPLPWDEALHVAADVASALAHAHDLAVLHRDVKPTNILVAAGRRVKVSDFGIAKIAGLSSLTPDGHAPGTVPYMAAELFNGGEASAQTDIHALGVVLYEMLTGRGPFTADTASGTISRILAGSPLPPSAHVPGIPPAVDELALRCIDRDPGSRPASAFALEGELRALLDVPADPAALAPPPRLSLASVRPPRHGERRRVVLLAIEERHVDAVAAERDHDAVRRHRHRVHAELHALLDRFDGRVAEVLDDGVLAVFGVPAVADTDHDRAVRCAERLIERLHGLELDGVRLSLAAAVHAGVLVASKGQDRWRVRGDGRRLVERLVATTPDGEVRVSARVVEGSRERNRFERAGEVTGTGTQTSEASYRPAAPAARPAAPLVGRGAEIAMLRALLAEVARGTGLVISVQAPAGMGKTRVVREALRGAAPDLPEARAIVVEARDEDRRTPHALFRDLLARIRGQPELEAALGERLGAANLRLLERQAQPSGAGTELQGEDRQAALRAAWVELLRALAATGPLVLVLEDLHWCDGPSRDLLDRILETAASLPLAFVLTMRPGASPPAASLACHRHLPLGPLPPADEAALFVQALGELGAQEEPSMRLGDRAEGNPLYVLELARVLHERAAEAPGEASTPAASVESTAVPESLHGILAARLDRLSPGERRLLQIAATIGRSVPVPLLSRVAGEPELLLLPRLRSLAARDLIVERESGFDFHHALIQEVTYATLVPAERRALHGLVADATQAACDDALHEAPETIGWHLARSDSPGLAVPFLEEAAERFRKAGDIAGALARLQEAAAALDAGGAPTAKLLELRAAAAEMEARLGRREQALADVERTAEQARALGARRAEALAWTVAALLLGWDARHAEALERLDRAMEAGKGLADDRLQARILIRKLEALMPLGRTDEALEAQAQLARIPTADATQQCDGLKLRAELLFALGRLPEAIAAIEDGERQAASTGEGFRHARFAVQRAVVLRELGRTEESDAAARAARERAVACGDLPTVLFADQLLALATVEAGDLAAGLTLAEELRARAESLGRHEQRGIAAWIASRAHAELGDLGAALAEAERALEAIASRPQARWRGTFTLQLADVELALGRLADADAHSVAAGRMAEAMHDDELLAQSWTRRLAVAELGGARPDASVARESLARARATGSARCWLDAAIVVAGVLAARGATDVALTLAREAAGRADSLRWLAPRLDAQIVAARILLSSGRAREAEAPARESLASAQAAGMRERAASAHAILAGVLPEPDRTSHGDSARQHLAQLARGLDPAARAACLGRSDRGWLWSGSDPAYPASESSLEG